MRTLEDSKKPKPSTKKQDNKSKPTQQQVVKTVKTSFFEPYSYKLECISHEDSVVVKQLLVEYLAELRKFQPEDKERVFKQTANKKIICFSSHAKANLLPPLKSQYCVVGIHGIVKRLLAGREPALVVVYFNPKNYELYEELFSCLLAKKMRYILIKNNEDKSDIVKALGIKQLNALALYRNEGFTVQFAQLQRLSLRCFVEIPCVYQNCLEPARIEELTVVKEKP